MPIPYGYKIEKGKAVIDEAQAEQVRMIYKGYLSGLAYVAAAEAAGLTLLHPGVKKMLQNKRYLGDKYYPATYPSPYQCRPYAPAALHHTRTGEDKAVGKWGCSLLHRVFCNI